MGSVERLKRTLASACATHILVVLVTLNTAASTPCMLQSNGMLNMTAVDMYKSKGQFMDGILNAMRCSDLPTSTCTNLASLSTGNRFCVMQVTGTCFCSATSIILSFLSQTPLTSDVLTRLALGSKCPPEFYPLQPNCLGDQLCRNLTATLTKDPILAKALILSLKQFYPSMKCIRDLARMSAFNWTAGELMNLTQGLAPDIVTDILSLIVKLTKLIFSPQDLKSMTSEALRAQPPQFIQNVLTTLSGSNKTSFLQQYAQDLRQATVKLLSQLEASPTDRCTLDKLTSSALRPSATDIALTNSLRPLTNVSSDDIKVLMSDPTLVGCFSDNEVKQVTPEIVCSSLINGTDPYLNLTASQQRTFREHCMKVFSAKKPMPPSLTSKASPSEIISECQNKSFDWLKKYFEQFSNAEYSLSQPQIKALQWCFDQAFSDQKFAGLDSDTIRCSRVAMRHVPVELVQKNFLKQSDKDNYCQQMAAGPFQNIQKRNVLSFCLNQTQMSICDLNDLLNLLSPADVDGVSNDTMVSCISVLGRKVSDPVTRRKILDKYLFLKQSWNNLTGDDFKAIASFAIDLIDAEVSQLKTNPNFGLALSAVITELLNQDVRTKMGEHGPFMQNLIDLASNTVIPAVIAASQAVSSSASGTPRKKRAASSGGSITCQSVVMPSSWPIDQLNNLSLSVFTNCPSALNVDGYKNPQLGAIANLAAQALGDPCRWNKTTTQQLGVIVFGLPPANISCMDFGDPVTISSVGGKRLAEKLDSYKSTVVYNTWSKQANITSLTSEMITSIGIVSCGISNPSLIPISEYDKASKFMGGIDCLSAKVLPALASYAMTLYGNGTSINISAVTNIGTIIAGMDQAFFNDLSPDKISAITPMAIKLVNPRFIASLTINQCQALTPAQAIALTDIQLNLLNGTALFDIIMRKRNNMMNDTTTVGPSSPRTSGNTALTVRPMTVMLANVTSLPQNGTRAPGEMGSRGTTAPGRNGPSNSSINGFPPGSGSSPMPYPGMNGTQMESGSPPRPNAEANGTQMGSGSSPKPNAGMNGTQMGSGSPPMPNAEMNGTQMGSGSSPKPNAGMNGTQMGSGSPPMPNAGTNGTQMGSGSSPMPNPGMNGTQKGSDSSRMPNDGANGTQMGSGSSPMPYVGANETRKPPAGTGEDSITQNPSNVATSSVQSLGNVGSSQNPSADVSVTRVVPAGATQGNQGGGNQETTTVRPTVPIPPVIDQKNILQFIDRLDEMSTDDLITRILPEALNSPAVLQSLKPELLTGTQFQALRNKVEQILAKPGFSFDPVIYASAGPLITKLGLEKLSDLQALLVVQEPMFQESSVTARLYGPIVGRALLSSVNAGDLAAKMVSCMKVMPGVPPIDFQKAIKNTLINNETIQSLSSVTFTEKQARLMYNKFLGDTPLDLSKKKPVELKTFFESLPSTLTQAVHPDSVLNIDSPSAADVILTVSASHVVTQMLDLGATRLSMPLQKRLYEKIRNASFVDLRPEHVLTLLLSRLLTCETVQKMNSDICEYFKIQLPFEIFLRNASINPAALSALYEKCKPILGSFCGSLIDQHGLLSIGAPPSDILNIRNDIALFAYCVPNFCKEIHLATEAQIDAMLTVVKAHLDKFHDFPLWFRRLDCLLPFLGVQYYNQIATTGQKNEICSVLSCQDCLKIPSQAQKEILDFCIKNGAPVKSLVCPLDGRGNCLMEPLTTDYVLHANITSTPEAVGAVDRLQGAVMDCSVRKELFKNIKGNLSVADKNSLVQYGSLVDQFSDDDWKTIPNKYLCGLLSMVSKIWMAWDRYQARRIAKNLKPVLLCTDRDAVLAKLQAADASPDCSGSGSGARRRKRETGSLTCDQIKQMESSASSLSVAQLQSLSPTEFINCIDILGRVPGFSEEQWAALASLAKQDQVYTSTFAMWSAESITSAAGIVTGLSATEISALRLDDINAINAIGHNGVWTVDKMLKAFAVVKQMYKNNNNAAFTSAELGTLGNIICGATVDDLTNMVASEVCGAIEDIGQLHTCEDQQLQVFAEKEKNCLGSDVTSWSPSTIAAIGSVVGGLTKDDISKLSQAQIQAISVEAMTEIPPIQFSGFTAAQFGYFSVHQAAVITTAQYQSLDANRQAVVQSKLASISDDVSRPPQGGNSGGKNDCAPLAASFLPLMTAILAIFMRI